MSTIVLNPQRLRNEPVNMTKGDDVGKKNARSPKMGAGSQMGPRIGVGFQVTGASKGGVPTGGKFAKANKAKTAKGTTKAGAR
jgi:hypothetical protein